MLIIGSEQARLACPAGSCERGSERRSRFLRGPERDWARALGELTAATGGGGGGAGGGSHWPVWSVSLCGPSH